jgi:hypothetical protein
MTTRSCPSEAYNFPDLLYGYKIQGGASEARKFLYGAA